VAAIVGLTVIKKFQYRGVDEEFSNRYYFSGSVPSSDSAWHTLFDALVAEEKKLYMNTVAVVRGYGYDDDDEDANNVWSIDLSTAPVVGTLTSGAGQPLSGDTANWVRWTTSRLNSKGKRIYLRKYFHPAIAQSTSAVDTAATGWRTAAIAFGTKLYDGSFADARTIRSRTHTETITAAYASVHTTTRTLKRRGKRPGP
jgi:hypothetical protein